MEYFMAIATTIANDEHQEWDICYYSIEYSDGVSINVYNSSFKLFDFKIGLSFIEIIKRMIKWMNDCVCCLVFYENNSFNSFEIQSVVHIGSPATPMMTSQSIQPRDCVVWVCAVRQVLIVWELFGYSFITGRAFLNNILTWE